jgi:hypothetical protein
VKCRRDGHEVPARRRAKFVDVIVDLLAMFDLESLLATG